MVHFTWSILEYFLPYITYAIIEVSDCLFMFLDCECIN